MIRASNPTFAFADSLLSLAKHTRSYVEKYLSRLLVFALCISHPVETYASKAPEEKYEMAGVCEIDGSFMVSLLNTDTSRGFWLREGQSLGELRFNSYDSETETAAFSYGESIFELKLRGAEDAAIAVVQSMPASGADLEEVNAKVDEYRKSLKVLLADPESGPRTPEAQARLENDLANMVTNYSAQLIAQLSEQKENLVLPKSEQSNKLSGIKRRNRVNSRIWASDHIDKHGLPTE